MAVEKPNGGRRFFDPSLAATDRCLADLLVNELDVELLFVGTYHDHTVAYRAHREPSPADVFDRS